MSKQQSTSHLVAKVGEIEEDEAIQVTIGEFVLAIFNHGGKFYATDDTCTHAFASLADGFIEDGCVECPIHAARFELATGKAMAPPADVDIKTYPVRVEGEDIYVELPGD